jgi:hypothetical protein
MRNNFRKGQKFGDWKYIGEGEGFIYLYKKGKKVMRSLIVKCICGKVCEVFYSNAIRGKSKNCGCLRRKK